MATKSSDDDKHKTLADHAARDKSPSDQSERQQTPAKDPSAGRATLQGLAMLIHRVSRDRAVNRVDRDYLAQWRGYYRNVESDTLLACCHGPTHMR
ncbi:hypothetical protein [Bradyrhizobium sp. CCBAU 53380]|uniref:hypothetical protein n=1 Tax=Bradyrhizobium sp. CCBAU 53380 TaxID=1325117 RepID=UPI0023048030|nr:hypothetical protein [Bradyrhizobium sp. CCBAU 53380]